MAYCRFSSDAFQCDVYVYDAGDLWITHIAANRPVSDTPIPAEATGADPIARMIASMEWIKTATRVDIGLPLDGTSHSDDTPGACADRLEELRKMGYNVPQSAIDALRAEHKEDGWE